MTSPMTYRILCSDGVERHGTAPTRQAALRKITFGTVCYLTHQIVPIRPDLADGTTAGVTDQPSDRPPLAPADSFASIFDVQDRIRKANQAKGDWLMRPNTDCTHWMQWDGTCYWCGMGRR